jgi:hypothetical protein
MPTLQSNSWAVGCRATKCVHLHEFKEVVGNRCASEPLRECRIWRPCLNTDTSGLSGQLTILAKLVQVQNWLARIEKSMQAIKVLAWITEVIRLV